VTQFYFSLHAMPCLIFLVVAAVTLVLIFIAIARPQFTKYSKLLRKKSTTIWDLKPNNKHRIT